MLERWKRRAKELKTDVYALYLACRDPRVPWYAKALAVVVVAYAFSPIDLIPDPIPILGYLDDLILIPVGVAAVVRMIPPGVMADCRRHARETSGQGKPTNWVAGAIVVFIWLALVVLAARLVLRLLDL